MKKNVNKNYGRTPNSSTEIEKVVSEIWADVLQRDSIRPEDDFFEQGGDSLMTMMVLFQVNDTLHIELPPGVLFEAPTLRQFCHVIDSKREESGLHCSEDDLPSDLLMKDRGII
jgi:acyl carrier protein